MAKDIDHKVIAEGRGPLEHLAAEYGGNRIDASLLIVWKVIEGEGKHLVGRQAGKSRVVLDHGALDPSSLGKGELLVQHQILMGQMHQGKAIARPQAIGR